MARIGWSLLSAYLYTDSYPLGNPEEPNLIPGNFEVGILFTCSGASYNVVKGNIVGTDIRGTVALGNSWDGVSTQSVAVYNLSGDTDTGAGNVLNDFQRYLALDAAVVTASITTIAGTLNSSPGTTFSIQFLSNPLADPSSYGQDQTYVGTTKVTTDNNGEVTFTLTLDIAVPSGQVISTTAADPDGNSSDFCQDLTVTAGASQSPIRAGSPLQELQPKAVSSESIHALDIVLSSANQPDEAALLELAMELTRTAQPRSKPVKWFQAPSPRFFQRPARGG